MSALGSRTVIMAVHALCTLDSMIISVFALLPRSRFVERELCKHSNQDRETLHMYMGLRACETTLAWHIDTEKI